MTERHHSRLLLALLRQEWEEAEALAALQPLDASILIDLCRQCSIPSYLHARLSDAERWAIVGDEVKTELTSIRNKVRQDNMLLLARTEQALDLLLAAGIAPVGLKGLDTLHRFYKNFDERTLDDVDLLVRREELDGALTALCSAGWKLPPEPERTHYIRSSHHLPLTAPGPLPVQFELHWNLAQELRYTIDVAGLFDRAVPLPVAGRQILRLEDHDLVAHLLVHHFSHYFGRGLKWLVDMRMIIDQPGFDWEIVAQRIRSWKAVVAAGISLVHLQKLWPGIIPDELLRSLPVPRWRRVLTSPLKSNHPLELFRHTGNRKVQLYLAALMLERPATLPAWLRHRQIRDRRSSENPLDPAGESAASTGQEHREPKQPS